MPSKIRFYACMDCGKSVQTRNRPGTGVCKSCNAYRNINSIANRGIKGNIKRPFEYAYNSLIRGARKMGRPVHISYEEYLQFTSVVECHYCFARINWTPHTNVAKKDCNYYLDRMDNSRGYEKDNLVVCCPKCNKIKSSEFTYSEFVKLSKFIKEMRTANEKA